MNTEAIMTREHHLSSKVSGQIDCSRDFRRPNQADQFFALDLYTDFAGYWNHFANQLSMPALTESLIAGLPRQQLRNLLTLSLSTTI